MLKVLKCFQLIAVFLIVVVCLPTLRAEDDSKIDINSAAAEKLMQLKGVGPKKARVIIEFRETNGPFQQPRDLLQVPGIGPKTFENNKDRITAEAAQ